MKAKYSILFSGRWFQRTGILTALLSGRHYAIRHPQAGTSAGASCHPEAGIEEINGFCR